MNWRNSGALKKGGGLLTRLVSPSSLQPVYALGMCGRYNVNDMPSLDEMKVILPLLKSQK
ncbi:hypothetical protein [Halomonas cupida]|uniref:hypothetical protein n=1 Tax=Halomonas cupida TaxID=44933 RepID=UPI003A94D64C